MKKLQNGEVRLAKNERRIGNFFVKDEAEHIKLSDLGGVFSHRVSKKMPVGIWLKNVFDMGKEGASTLQTYIATIWSAFSVAPDDEYVSDLLSATEHALSRHPDWYGVNLEPEEGKSDADVIEEERELQEFVDKVKEMPDGEAEK